MNNKVYAHAWDQLQQSTVYYQQLLGELPDEVLKQKPSEEGWSILQVIEHLVGAEGAVYFYLRRKAYAPIADKGILPNTLRSVMLKLALRSPLKFKAPNIEELKPLNNSKPQDLLARWQKLRSGLGEYLNKVPKEQERSPMFRHPRAGGLNLQQTLGFMADHLDHHKKQVDQQLARIAYK